ncbi:MAG: VWA domain-containing protein [Acidobacteria bacterium]|nr:VWA domain-containing protein [Acidobacteriota bacterium]
MPPPPIDPNDFMVSSELDIVLLDVSVKDSRGGWASGLSKDNFRVFENERPQEISIFAAQDIPVTVGMVVDNSGSVRPKRPHIVTAALALVEQSHPQDEFFIVNFNDRIRMGLPRGIDFTDDASRLRNGLLANPVQGRTALYDAIKVALAHLDKGRRDKKTLVVISDGGDNASECSEQELLELIRTSPATIYTVGIFNPHDKDKNPGLLKRIAGLSGGEAFMPGEIAELVGICEKIAQDIRNRYTVGYTPSDRNFDGKVRKIRVAAAAPDRGKLQVKTRTQYLAVPPASKLRSARRAATR